MKKVGGGLLISRVRRKAENETKERGRKDGGIMGIERDFDQAYLCFSSLPTIPVSDSKNIYGRKNIQSNE